MGKTSNFSAAVRYQSLAMGLSANLLFFRLAFAFRFLIYIVVWADTATNTQAAHSPGRYRQA